MIQRVHEKYTAEEMAQVYATPHDHSIYGHGHWMRVEFAKVMVRWCADNYTIETAGDLSCGNAAIINALHESVTKHLGDFAPGYEYTGPIEETILLIPNVDLFVCSETLEHLDDPISVLGSIRDKSSVLLLSTPIDAWNDSNNEHYWAWDREEIDQMLENAGWTLTWFASLDSRVIGESYNYGFWVAE